MEKPFSFYLVTDTHYFDSSFKSTGEAYEKRSVTDQKCIAETPAIIDAGFEQIVQDKDTDVILIPGDLVYRGEYQSHIGFRERLYKLKEQGKKIYLITARYDYCEDGEPCEFEGNETISVKGMPRAQLRDFYKDFGFDDAISEHRECMSYVSQIADGIRLLALN
ncbi:metallophosphoesterase, partial [Eubacterium sp.]|uniref:metallophosphoesterase n=1 Tax=Eubacterium sp. TaxID=142586 RepID=UPI002A7F5A36